MNVNSDAFISLWEKDVVLLKNKGNSFEAIAAKYMVNTVEVKRAYEQTVDKLHSLIKETTVLGQIFPCNTVNDFLDQLGINCKGRDELAESIRISYLQPDLVDNIAKELIPIVAKIRNCSDVLTRGRIYSAVRKAYSQSLNIGTPAQYFFQQSGLRSRGVINLKDFLLASHDCITELFYLIPVKQEDNICNKDTKVV